jgi:hypothetical protein
MEEQEREALHLLRESQLRQEAAREALEELLTKGEKLRIKDLRKEL